ncbi:hypothetical protein [Bacillus sp. Marseille-P3661]|uniref:hypothetical protein n=1 Tax=Bacillus sp. Marseille-P3661 TaxID=1936234 RepID=UPI000C84B8D9|nr:hypothetical protein [Bacillus sp. Marseille-P3661]
MKLFLKHEIKKTAGKYEVFLFINKKSEAIINLTDDSNNMIKKSALDYIFEKLDFLPIRVVRIMIGPVPYFSFALNKDKEPYNLSKV